MAPWTVALCDHVGVPLVDLAVEATLRWERNNYCSIKPKLHHADGQTAYLADAILNGLPLVKCYRHDSLPTALRLTARWAPQSEDSGDGGEDPTLDAEFRSPFAGLQQRYAAAAETYTGEDAGAVAVAHLNAANTDHPTGLIPGTVEATVTRDRSYDAGQERAQAIIDLTTVDGGFDFTEQFLDPLTSGGALAQLNIAAQLGDDISDTVRFEFGEGTLANTVSVSRTLAMPVNRATVTGDTSTGLVPAIAEDAASIDKYGLWEKWESVSDVTEQATLQETAAGLLVPDPLQVVTFEPDPTGSLQPWEHYWLGNTVAFRAAQDALQFAADVDINAIEIDIDQDGNEAAHRVEFGDQPPPTLPRQWRAIRQRLAALERH